MIEYHEYEGVYFWIPDCRDTSATGHLMKIGRSKDVFKRSQGLQTSCPYPLLQLWRLWVPGMEVGVLERHLHQEFAKFHVHHEWFAIPSIHWEVTKETMDLYFEHETWECLINNGELERMYLPPRLPRHLCDEVKKTALTRIRANDARRVGA